MWLRKFLQSGDENVKMHFNLVKSNAELWGTLLERGRKPYADAADGSTSDGSASGDGNLNPLSSELIRNRKFASDVTTNVTYNTI
jgi:hypothetical protein